MNAFDWLVFLLPTGIVLWIAFVMRRYIHDATDFLTGGRCAGRYLICNAEGTAAFGAVTIIAIFEMIYRAGFAIGWWNMLAQPIWLIITLSGYMVYRYRETRVMTLPEFFERRYSRRFRFFMGMLGWISGIAIFGIVPAVGARFFVHYFHWPLSVEWLGISMPTFALVMAILLSLNVCFATLGGQLTALVTDCVEGLISGVMFVIIAVIMLYMVDWNTIVEAMSNRPHAESMLHPFHTSETKDFNIWYILIGIVGGIYGFMTTQGSGTSCTASAATPHEAKMGRILGQWRGGARTVMIVLLAIGAYAFLNHPSFSEEAHAVHERLQEIENPQIQEQMRVPVTVSYMLPAGAKGIFAAIVLFAIMAADSAAIQSLASVLVQDIILPQRSRPLSRQSHLKLLRLAVVGVAALAFVFGLIFRQTDYLFMYMAVTGAIYVSGAGAVMIGGMYTSKGTVHGAWAAMLSGAAVSIGGIIWQQISPEQAPNGQWIFLYSIIAACLFYVGVSFPTYRADFNLDQLLHRGRYAVDETGKPLPAVERPARTWRGLIGIDEQCTRGDKFLCALLFIYVNIYFGIFVVATVWNLIDEWPESWWANYWYGMGIVWSFCLALITTVWFTWGGIRDLRMLFKRLRAHPSYSQRHKREPAEVSTSDVVVSCVPVTCLPDEMEYQSAKIREIDGPV